MIWINVLMHAHAKKNYFATEVGNQL